jgi:hypothetical protein
MLRDDQLRLVARQIDREADDRIHTAEDDRFDRQQLWEVVRRASRAIEAVTEIEAEDATAQDRIRRARYLVSELEDALEAARRARVVLNWMEHRRPDQA